MKSLFIVDTLFQIITLVNMRIHMNEFEKVDLLITVNGKEADSIINRLNKTGLFGNVYRFTQDRMKITRMFDRYNPVTWKCYKRKLRFILSGKKERGFLFSNGFTFDKYDNIYFGSPHMISYLQKIKVPLYLFDEGYFSYTDLPHETDLFFEKIFLYEPELAEYYEEHKDRIFSIPKLSYEDKEIRKWLNYIFDYDNTAYSIPSECVIFFAQPLVVPPFYYRFIPKVVAKRVRGFKKHISWEKPLEELRKALETIAIKHKNCVVKLHPLAIKQDLNILYFKESGYVPLPGLMIPWEMILLNEDFRHIKLVTNYSTAITSSYIYFDGDRTDIKSYFLYPLLNSAFLSVMPHGVDETQLKLIKRLVSRYAHVNYSDDVNDI